jgi:hypothetical protein
MANVSAINRLFMQDQVRGSDKVRRIVRGGDSVYYQHPRGVISTPGRIEAVTLTGSDIEHNHKEAR